MCIGHLKLFRGWCVHAHCGVYHTFTDLNDIPQVVHLLNDPVQPLERFF